MMKSSQLVAFLGLLFLGTALTTLTDIAIPFEGATWVFPMTVGEAVSRYKLSYKPPGYYYTKGRSGSTISLENQFQTGDYANEAQPEHTLYNRTVHSYVFRYEWKEGRFDSLRNTLQKQFGRTMPIQSDTAGMVIGGTKVKLNAPLDLLAVTYGLMPLESGLVVALREKPRMSVKEEKEIEVLFMHSRSDKEMKQRIMSF